jgi:Domain of unknown function (DUF4232)
MVGRGLAAGLALAAVALTAAGCGGGTTTTVTVTRTHTVTTTRTVTKPTTTTAAPCTGSQLSGTFAVVAGSAGAGQISYLLTLKNSSQTRCYVSGIPNAILLGSGGAPLPTHIAGGTGAGQKVILAAGSSTKATARFSPTVAGTGDSTTGPCQPKAQTLQVTPNGGGTTAAPIQPPTSVCEQGTLDFQAYG